MSSDVFLAYAPNSVKPGWIAFFFVIALCVATFFLWRNMNKQLGKVKVPFSAEFREQQPEAGPAARRGDSPDETTDPPV